MKDNVQKIADIIHNRLKENSSETTVSYNLQNIQYATNLFLEAAEFSVDIRTH